MVFIYEEQPFRPIRLEIIDHNNIKTMESMNRQLFPVEYKESFSRQVILDRNTVGYLFVLNQVYVGLCTYNIGRSEAYIMTFGILELYRGLGIGMLCLSLIESHITKTLNIHHFKLHVHISNFIAKRFYLRCGYRIVGLDQNYYSKMIPRTAYIFCK